MSVYALTGELGESGGTVLLKVECSPTDHGGLAIILGDVVTQLYPVKPVSAAAKLEHLPALETRFDQWYISLPEQLRFDGSNKRFIPPPTILLLNIRYWGSVQLLHRCL